MAKDSDRYHVEIVRLLNRGYSDFQVAAMADVDAKDVVVVRLERDAAEIRCWLKFGDTSKEIVAAGYKQQQVAAIIGANAKAAAASQAQLG
jgi:hypothetical protein